MIRIGNPVAAAFIAVCISGCTTATGDEVARAGAKAAVRPVIADRFPGVPLEPSVDCIIDSASATEILQLAADSVTGPNAGTADLVLTIASRPDAIRCLATEGLTAFI